ncbi:MAG: ribose-phosphate diphosphokinase [Nanoarchaeota archaeon]
MSYRGEIALIANNSGRYFAEGVAGELGIHLIDAEDRDFEDSEGRCVIGENVRGRDVYVIQCFQNLENKRVKSFAGNEYYTVNDNFMYMLTAIDAASRAIAGSITAVVLPFPYQRQDAQFKIQSPDEKHQREGITASLVPKFLKTAGANYIMTLSLHARQIRGYADSGMGFEDLSFRPVAVDYIKDNHPELVTENTSLLSPDPGGAGRARAYAARLGLLVYGQPKPGKPIMSLPTVIGDKERVHKEENLVDSIELIGNVEGRDVLAVDDIIGSGSTIVALGKECRDRGARSMQCLCTYAQLTGRAEELLGELYEDGFLSGVFASNAIRHGKTFDWLEEIPVEPLIAKAIDKINKEESISELTLRA